ncbi:MAG: filamentous hemagglutinin family protein [Verrucomicrobiota bacterium]
MPKSAEHSVRKLQRDTCAPVCGSMLATALLLATQPARAGDILRNGAAAPNPANRTSGPSTGAAQAAAARANAKDALARTSRAVEAVQRAQQNAIRAAAANNNAGADPNRPGFLLPNVPNGLAPGGLQAADGAGTQASLWTGAFLPTQTTASASGKTQVNIRQTSPQAVLNWKTFNVGRDTSLHFDQTAGGENAGQWIAFNKVSDPSGNPSQILGSITAPGQVYVINQNGIIFGGASQVNVHTLMASSLPINDALIQNGLLNQQTSAQFLLSALPQAGATPFTPPAPPASGRIGDVTVQAGARLTAPSNASKVGGRIALAGPNVTNAGSISTPDGQTILAAGLQVGFAAHSSDDPSLRGLDVYIGAVADPASGLTPYAGTATNTGLIESPRGSVTMAGRDVRQLAAADAGTSVALNGRIDLLASYNAVNNTAYDPVGRPNAAPWLYGAGGPATSTGTVTFGPGSVTRILPEWGSPDKVIGTSLSLRSQVNVQGRILHMDDGAMIHAPNGNVTFNAGVWDYAGSSSTPPSGFVRADGQIYLGRGALINVAGTTDADSPLSNYILSVTLRASELADSPLQRQGLLRGGEITVDLRKTGTYNGRAWVGTPLADLTGYLNLIQRSVGELTVGGGSVNLNSGGSVIVQKDAGIDVSAGWVNHSGGFVETTRLMRAGALVDIASAMPDRVYDSVFTGEFVESHPRWNIERAYRIPWMSGGHYEAGYLQGADAGRLGLAGASMAIDGTLRGSAVSGFRQIGSPAEGGSLKLDFQVEQLVAGTGAGVPVSPAPPTVTFSNRPGQTSAEDFILTADGGAAPLRGDRVENAVLPAGWLGDNGFASLEVNNPDGAVIVPRGIALNAPAGGSVTLSGSSVSVLGGLKAPGGTITLNAYKVPPSIAAALKRNGGGEIPASDPSRGRFALGAGAVIDAAGLIVDNRPGSGTFSQLPGVTNGGTVSVHTYSADLAAGSLIDVSGGVVFGPAGERAYGNAGKIEIIAGQDRNLLSVDGGSFKLGGILKGYSGTATGGTLSLQAQLIRIGGSLVSPVSLRLDPAFFSQGGFSTFNLTGLGEAAGNGEYSPGLLVADGTAIEPKVLSWLARPNGGTGGSLALTPFEKLEYQRAAAKLNLSAKGVRNDFTGQLEARGDLVFGRGASILTDALGGVSLKGDTVAMLGGITAPGGSITISGANSLPQVTTPPDFAQTTVWLASGARLSTAGKFISYTNRYGHTTGSVAAGGGISVSGNIVAEAGAVLDVSGTTGNPALHPNQLGLDADGRPLAPGSQLVSSTSGLTTPLYQSLARPTKLDSGGGSITLSGGQMLLTDATLLGRAGGGSAPGGTLAISSGKFRPVTTAETNLVVTQSGRTLPASPSNGASVIGQPVSNADGGLVPGMGYFAAGAFAAGGFDSLTLGGNVEFRGNVSIQVDRALRVASGGVIRAGGLVNLAADHIMLGQAFVPPLRADDTQILFSSTSNGNAVFVPPTAGSGQLTASARLIDAGTLTLQGIGLTTLDAARGEIRGNGTLNAAGRLNLAAGQIYPTTGSSFNIVVYDAAGSPGTLTIQSGAARDLPLSAGGSLNLFARSIVQGGVLRAPFGSIRLGWDGTGTAPFTDPVTGTQLALPVTENLTLAAGSRTSVSAVDPRTGQAITVPYGYVTGGGAWIDPSGVDISSTGPPERLIQLGARNLTTQTGSLIDIRGGGDLQGYRFVAGNGGSKDVLLNEGSFAILPGYGSAVDPYAPYNPRADTFGGDPGYVNSTLKAGDSIYLAANDQLPAGTYTLLPARYALQHGAWLVTPLSGPAIGSAALPDGSSAVSGYRFNTVDPGAASAVQARFELASGAVVRQRSAYDDFSANAFFREAAAALKARVPRLPADSGRLVLQATQTAMLNGSVAAKALAAGRGGLVDISSTADIFIGGGSHTSGPAGSLFLHAEQLNAMGAESLLVGGIRTYTASGANVAVSTGSLTLDNAGASLIGSDIVLTAKNSLILADGASILARGAAGGQLDSLTFGNAAAAGSGNGLMVRMSSDTSGSSSRSGVTPGGIPLLSAGAGVRLEGQSLTLDSTAGTSLHPDAALLADAINLFSGRISLVKEHTGAGPDGDGLALSGLALSTLEQRARDLYLSSYTSLDLYGTGTVAIDGSLRLSAGQIRGFGQNSGGFQFTAPSIILDNAGNASVSGTAAASGNLILTGNTITLGSGSLRIDQFENVQLNASAGLTVSGSGSLTAAGNVGGVMPFITGKGGATHGIKAGGSLTFNGGAGSAESASGLGADITLSGNSVSLGTSVILPSGRISVTALTGDLEISGGLSAAGTSQAFYDAMRYTNAGEIRLSAGAGDIRLLAGSVVDVSGATAGGNAGEFSVSAANGDIMLGGGILGRAGAGGLSGRASFDLKAASTLSDFNADLDKGGFFESRTFRVRTGDVTLDGTARARTFRLAADSGSITVSGAIDASGETGGEITLSANGSLTLLPSARLTAAARTFSNAGKGGAISLQSGSSRDGTVPAGTVLDLQAGSVIDLSVASLVEGSLAAPGSSAFNGQFSGTLQLRAPRAAGNDELGIAAIGSTITGASSILAEGYQLTGLSGTAGTITSAVQSDINASATAFMSHEAGITTRLLGADGQGLGSIFVLAPGAEIINRDGDLTLGASTSTSTGDWSLHSFRYGSKLAPGVLTLRATGDLIFNNALSDGFTPLTTGNAGQRLWLATVMALNPALPANTQSWSYHLTAGADLLSASSAAVLSGDQLAAGEGSLQLGKFYEPDLVSGETATTANAVQDRYQVIRTGTGDISIHAARDVRLNNVFASIYTAGARLATPQSIFGTDDFTIPLVVRASQPPNGDLGASQQSYAPSWTMAGGNVGVSAGGDIGRYTMVNGELTVDSSRQLPNNWLYRRGRIDPATGAFGASGISNIQPFRDPASSTTWWIDFSNFFQGFGALGGGDVTLSAGHDVVNADAVAPTNARMPGRDAAGNPVAPDASKLVELGGGDIRVTAGRNIDGGLYYVERGDATLRAGGGVTTNAARSPSLGNLGGTSLSPENADLIQSGNPEIYDPLTWLPTSFFLGRGNIEVSARGDILTGPVTNTFLLPQGLNNKYWYKTWFSTYGQSSSFDTVSLGGGITYRLAVNLPGAASSVPTLIAWMAKQNLGNVVDGLETRGSNYQPWIRLAETDVAGFDSAASMLPGTVRGTAYAGDITVTGNMTLSPSATGTLELLSSGAINGISATGPTRFSGTARLMSHTSARITLSDASPALIPGITTPFVDQSAVATTSQAQRVTTVSGAPLGLLLSETGSFTGTDGSIATKNALHAPGILHSSDKNPLLLYGGGGDISGLTLFSAKAARVIAGRDITDVGLYIQNTAAGDISLVSAGGDLIPFNESSALRSAATNLNAGNILTTALKANSAGGSTNAASGDIQISGPGVLEVLAGGRIDLGTGSNFIDGTGVGITSIGNLRNPNLPLAGADLIVMAGVRGPGGAGAATSLTGSALNIKAFTAQHTVEGAAPSAYAAKLDTENAGSPTDEQKAIMALETFFGILKNSGRDAAVTGSYAEGYAAIDSLFGPAASAGAEILGRSRNIRTSSGGAISIAAPDGGLSMASQIFGNPLAPPGIVTEAGGSISIFTNASVSLGQARIFTLRGGNITIWSSTGDIAAGSAAKTVVSAPPTRVLIDTASADVNTDLAGLATGGGIGVLATVANVPAGDVDLIAPVGAVDAGDAGIRSSGNLTIAAAQVLNASNIAVAGTSAGTPAAAPTAPAITSAAPAPPPPTNANPAADAAQAANTARQQTADTGVPLSVFTVEVIGYGGSDPAVEPASGTPDDEEEKEKRRRETLQQEIKNQDSTE